MNRLVYMRSAAEACKHRIFPAYAWPGGYPIVYLDKNGCVVCPDCAFNDAIAGSYFGPYTPAIHWEGDPLFCDECGKEIASAYGPIEEPQP